jgi:hypothetical protein
VIFSLQADFFIAMFYSTISRLGSLAEAFYTMKAL